MKTKLLGLIACMALLSLAAPASASVYVESFTVDPTTISAGDSALVDLTLGVAADGSDTNAYFTGGSVTLADGTGSGNSETFSIVSGLTSENFQYTFNYPTAGQFLPSFSYTADYTEEYYDYYEYYTGPYYYTEGCPFDCQTYEYYDGPYTGLDIYNYNEADSNSGNTPLTVTPLPAGLPLFATGLGAMGLFGWRRKRKNAATTARPFRCLLLSQRRSRPLSRSPALPLFASGLRAVGLFGWRRKRKNAAALSVDGRSMKTKIKALIFIGTPHSTLFLQRTWPVAFFGTFSLPLRLG
jgi:hypothetical protein